MSEIEDAYSLSGRIAVVTGAASGIGRETARLFAKAGARVLMADRDEQGVKAAAGEIGEAAEPLYLDVTDREQVNRLAERARALGSLDVWANVAGIITTPTPVVDVDEATLDRVIAVNLKGVYWGCAAAARVMAPQGKGSIINISSAGADIPAPDISVYALTKAAVNMISRSLAIEVGGQGVRVNTVSPGFVDTPMVTYRFTRPDGSIDKDVRTQVFNERAAKAALGRIGEPSDIAMALLFLASDASRFVTGQVLRVNGGSVMP